MGYIIWFYIALCSQLIMLKAFSLINPGLIGWTILAPAIVYLVCWVGQFVRGFLGLQHDHNEEEFHERRAGKTA